MYVYTIYNIFLVGWTHNPHWGYGLGKGQKISTQTHTPAYPTQNPPRF